MQIEDRLSNMSVYISNSGKLMGLSDTITPRKGIHQSKFKKVLKMKEYQNKHVTQVQVEDKLQSPTEKRLIPKLKQRRFSMPTLSVVDLK